MTSPVFYFLSPHYPEAHLFEVCCRVETPDPAGQVFSLPLWIPGSYLIREFARHVVCLEAEAGGKAVAVEKIDKATWRAAPCCGALTVCYRIYARELSVRAAYLDMRRGFLNGTSVFLRPRGLEEAPCVVELLPPAHTENWRVATALQRDSAPAWGFGRYRAENYADLIEHPVDMGDFLHLEFSARGVPHYLILSGVDAPELHAERLCRDLARLCEWQMDLFGEPALTEPYYFLVHVTDSGYGGLEHRNAAALLCERWDLPAPGLAEKSSPEGYRGFLGLASHEYFHRWNVRRIRPEALRQADGAVEAYTRLLWFFEGITSYYGDLCLKRAGLIDEVDYLTLLAKIIAQVQKTPGRHVQSLAESSFDAWIKCYRPDENTPNTGVSYYAKGALLALCLDRGLRCLRADWSLDTLMRALWRNFGVSGPGLTETEIFTQVACLGNDGDAALQRKTRQLARWLEAAVTGIEDLPLEATLAQFGVHLALDADDSLPWIGVQWCAENEAARIRQVRSGSPAEQAGLATDDEIVALAGLRLTQANRKKLLARFAAGQTVDCHYFRQGRLMTTRLTFAAAPAENARLTPKPGGRAAALRAAWLGAAASGQS
ncbi:MAG: PDZ domain-containing protein [Zoogloeaceae bacterium]|nr:PDZ domain-containing protein [Zoogloeaceae bacterium]